MPRYHFAVKDADAARYHDPDGTELPDDAAARDYSASNRPSRTALSSALAGIPVSRSSSV